MWHRCQRHTSQAGRRDLPELPCLCTTRRAAADQCFKSLTTHAPAEGKRCCYPRRVVRSGVEQLGTRSAHNPEVGGSSEPAASGTLMGRRFGCATGLNRLGVLRRSIGTSPRLYCVADAGSLNCRRLPDRVPDPPETTWDSTGSSTAIGRAGRQESTRAHPDQAVKPGASELVPGYR